MQYIYYIKIINYLYTDYCIDYCIYYDYNYCTLSNVE